MSDKDFIKDLFSEKLGNYEAKVNPELWNSIASQIGTAGAAGTTATGLSLAAKWLIGVGIAGALTVTTVLLVQPSEEPKEDAPVVENTNPTATESEVSPENESTAPVQLSQENVVATNAENGNINPAPPVEPLNSENNSGGLGLPTRSYKPLLVVDTQNDKIIQQIIERTPVHVKDPAVNEPLMPEPLPAEVIETPAETVQEKEHSVGDLPNIFTPNNDGANDNFRIESHNLTNFHIVVIDAQNKVVFESRDPRFSWDGRDLSGNKVPAGKYVYYISADEFSKDSPRRYSPLLINY